MAAALDAAADADDANNAADDTAAADVPNGGSMGVLGPFPIATTSISFSAAPLLSPPLPPVLTPGGRAWWEIGVGGGASLAAAAPSLAALALAARAATRALRRVKTHLPTPRAW